MMLLSMNSDAFFVFEKRIGKRDAFQFKLNGFFCADTSLLRHSAQRMRHK